jgi:hypothetical protein
MIFRPEAIVGNISTSNSSVDETLSGHSGATERHLSGFPGYDSGQKSFRGDSPMRDRPFPDPVTPQPEVAALRRERNLWLRREANLVLGRDETATQQARTAHLVLTYALAIIERRPAVIGSFADLTRECRGEG